MLPSLEMSPEIPVYISSPSPGFLRHSSLKIKLTSPVHLVYSIRPSPVVKIKTGTQSSVNILKQLQT